MFPFQQLTSDDDEDQWFKSELFFYKPGFDQTGAVVTIVISIKEWCHEWRAYWFAFGVQGRATERGQDAEDRFMMCKSLGSKLPDGIAKAMAPWVEDRYEVRYSS